MRKVWVVLVATLTGLLLGVAGAVGASVTDPDTIVRVEGDAANGFGIHRHDGSALFPPTGSEARAECGEYDTLRARVRCRAEVRTWYRDLADIKDALRLAHQSG